MRRLSGIERLVLRDLLASEKGLYAYTFWRRYRMSPSQMEQVLQRFVKKGIIIFDGKRIRVTERGLKWLLENRINIFPVKKKPWRECPEEFVQPQHLIEAPFIPRLSKIDVSWRRDLGKER